LTPIKFDTSTKKMGGGHKPQREYSETKNQKKNEQEKKPEKDLESHKKRLGKSKKKYASLQAKKLSRPNPSQTQNTRGIHSERHSGTKAKTNTQTEELENGELEKKNRSKNTSQEGGNRPYTQSKRKMQGGTNAKNTAESLIRENSAGRGFRREAGCNGARRVLVQGGENPRMKRGGTHKFQRGGRQALWVRPQ